MRIHGVVLISGANRGIGLELTKSLIDNPNVTKIYAGSRNLKNVEDLKKIEDPKRKLRLIELDVSKDGSIKETFNVISSETGKLNVLMNNAAILERNQLAGIPNGERAAWLRHFDTNTVSQEMMPLLSKSVSDGEKTTILNISGFLGSIEIVSGQFALDCIGLIAGNLAYMCSKTALNMLTKEVSLLYPNILTISICPGWNRTEMGGPNASEDPAETAPEVIAAVDKMTTEHSGQFWNRKGEKIPF